MKWNETRPGTPEQPGPKTPEYGTLNNPGTVKVKKTTPFSVKYVLSGCFIHLRFSWVFSVHGQTAVWFPQAAQAKHTKSQPIFETDLSS